MAPPTNLTSIELAERLFRLFHAFCTAPNPDSLFSFLNALHSASDQLKKSHSSPFYSFPEFAALKAIRNYFHHFGTVLHTVSVHPAASLVALTVDLTLVCLVPSAVIDDAIAATDPKFKPQAEASRTATFRQWRHCG